MFEVSFQRSSFWQVTENSLEQGVWRTFNAIYEGVSKSFRTGRLEPELQTIQLSATRCSCIAM